MYDNFMDLREKIYRMFILGFEGENITPNLSKALHNGLGGVIFFTRNIKSEEQFKKLVQNIKKEAKYPLFLSIDQEGGRVERTLNLYNGQKYLSAREAAKRGEDFVKKQTEKIAKELKSFGLNMNFAPVLDVDTNPANPIIAERSFSSDPSIVAKMGEICAKTHLENGIIPVGKHFPGHGETSVDSHKEMPELFMGLEELEKTHILPFKHLIECKIPALMAAHIHYSAFDEEKVPASVSKNVLSGYLRGILGFRGLIISDDMVMGGIKCFSPLEACLKGLEAGINMFIYRDADDAVMELIENLVNLAQNGEIDAEKIDDSVKIINTVGQALLDKK